MNSTDFDKEKFLHPPEKISKPVEEDLTLGDVIKLSRKYTAALSKIVDECNATIDKFNREKDVVTGVNQAFLIGEAQAIARISAIIRDHAC